MDDFLDGQRFDDLVWVLDYVAESSDTRDDKLDVTDAARRLIAWLKDRMSDDELVDIEQGLTEMRPMRCVSQEMWLPGTTVLREFVESS